MSRRPKTLKIKDFNMEKDSIQSSLRTSNTIGYTGIKKTLAGSYIAQISVNSIRYHIGTYNTDKEAALAYDQYIDDNNLCNIKNFE